MSDRVAINVSAHIAHVTLTRADKMNALDPAMFEAICAAIDELNTLLGGGNVGSQATFDVYEFTATASQTTFSLSSNHGQGSDITAGNFVDGTTYIITSVGTTDFVTLYGASSNTVGVTFTANTNPGTGDGTAKVQDDDIIRSKTIGKVTIGNSDSGVKLVSCVLYCG